jgi:hypothetical protein
LRVLLNSDEAKCFDQSIPLRLGVCKALDEVGNSLSNAQLGVSATSLLTIAMPLLTVSATPLLTVSLMSLLGV